jgi:hypothetical protein
VASDSTDNGSLDPANMANNQYVIQYVMADGQEVTIGEQAPQVKQSPDVITDGGQMSQSIVDVQDQDPNILQVSMDAQDIGTMNIEQHAPVLNVQEDICQPLVLDFGHAESDNSRLPPNIVQIPSMVGVQTVDGIENILTLDETSSDPAQTVVN